MVVNKNVFRRFPVYNKSKKYKLQSDQILLQISLYLNNNFKASNFFEKLQITNFGSF